MYTSNSFEFQLHWKPRTLEYQIAHTRAHNAKFEIDSKEKMTKKVKIFSNAVIVIRLNRIWYTHIVVATHTHKWCRFDERARTRTHNFSIRFGVFERARLCV